MNDSIPEEEGKGKVQMRQFPELHFALIEMNSQFKDEEEEEKCTKGLSEGFRKMLQQPTKPQLWNDRAKPLTSKEFMNFTIMGRFPPAPFGTMRA